jgi:hypothetical protein
LKTLFANSQFPIDFNHKNKVMKLIPFVDLIKISIFVIFLQYGYSALMSALLAADEKSVFMLLKYGRKYGIDTVSGVDFFPVSRFGDLCFLRLVFQLRLRQK